MKVGTAASCTTDRLLMVFVSLRPVPVCRGADSPGCYIKELWVCRGPDAASRTHKLSWNYPGAEIYMGKVTLLILAQAYYISSAPETKKRRRRKRGEKHRGEGAR